MAKKINHKKIKRKWEKEHKRKQIKEIPDIPNKIPKIIAWFIVYHWMKFVGVLLVITGIIAFCIMGITFEKNKKGKMIIKKIEKPKIDIEIKK